jgi:hypothetical protein
MHQRGQKTIILQIYKNIATRETISYFLTKHKHNKKAKHPATTVEARAQASYKTTGRT